MIKLVHKEGNISLTAPTGYKQSEVNEMLAAQEERLEKEHLEEIEDINEAHDEEITEINEAHSKEVADINTAHANEVDAINEAHTKEVNELNTEHANEISELNAAHEQAVEDLNTAHGQVVNDLNGQIGELNADISELNAEINDLEEQLAAADPSQIPTDEELVVTGDCFYRFSNNGWNWFIEKYGDRITTKDITKISQMFVASDIKEIPFDINLKDGTNAESSGIFFNSGILKAPYINGTIKTLDDCFKSCTYLNYIPEDWASHIDWTYIHSNATAYLDNMFMGCQSLKKIPQSLIDELWGVQTSYFYVSYYAAFQNCYVLEEINNMPINKSTLTSNVFSNTVDSCHRLKGFTFVLQEDGMPYTVQWKSQTFDFSKYVGYASGRYQITNYNSGITEDKEVKDDATYQALKNDPDWYTCNIAYSRYNHDSAVATINSLPDTSAYLASAGGTNTIKFKGAAGSKTDGGAINTLTEAEIAVAAAKGWTVTLA